jgi:hypothetical protein
MWGGRGVENSNDKKNLGLLYYSGAILLIVRCVIVNILKKV